MSIDPLDRPHDQQPVPGQDQNPSQNPEPGFITNNPDVQRDRVNGAAPSADRPAPGPGMEDPGGSIDDSNEPGLNNPLP